MAKLAVKAILPKELPTNPTRATAGMYTALDAVVIEVQRIMSTYPPWRPWKNPPKTGLRAGGKRTGSYGKGWRLSRERFTLGGNPGVRTINNVVYASYVGGSEGQQARALAARGWPSITAIAKDVSFKMNAAGKLKIY